MKNNKNMSNPFKEIKRTNWAKKTQDKLIKNENNNVNNSNDNFTKTIKSKIKKEPISSTSNIKIKRVAKSFKIFPGKVVRDFDKRINKLQVHFDDLDFDKTYIDSGKYLMFLMSFAEKYGIYELYKNVDAKTGEFKIENKKIINHFGNKLK